MGTLTFDILIDSLPPPATTLPYSTLPSLLVAPLTPAPQKKIPRHLKILNITRTSSSQLFYNHYISPSISFFLEQYISTFLAQHPRPSITPNIQLAWPLHVRPTLGVPLPSPHSSKTDPPPSRATPNHSHRPPQNQSSRHARRHERGRGPQTRSRRH